MQNKLKIAFVAPRLPADGAVGGAETLLFNLAKLAVEEGFDVWYLTTCAKNHFTWENTEPAGESVYQGVRVVKFPVNSDRDVGAFLQIQTEICNDVSVSDHEEEVWARNSVNSDALIEFVKAGNFDRIVAGPYLFGMTMAVAAVAPERTLLVPCLHDEAFARVRLVAKMFHEVRGYLFNTEKERELAVRLYGKKIEGKVQSGVVGFPLPAFQSDHAAGHRISGVNGPYVIYCGRREPLKGTPIVIEYWAAFRATHPDIDLKLVMTGSGEYETPKGCEGHIIDKGFVSEQDKHDLMAGAVAFCHASVNESLGIVLLESWLAGRPVLVHASGVVLTDQARRSNGGLWFRDFIEFNECLETLLANEELASALGKAGKAFTLANYSPDTVKAKLSAALLK